MSNEMHGAVFRSGETALSWCHLFISSVDPDGQGAALQLTTAVVPGAPKSLMDRRNNQKASTKLLEAVQAVMDSGSAPSPPPVESFALLADGTSVPWTSGDFPGL